MPTISRVPSIGLPFRGLQYGEKKGFQRVSIKRKSTRGPLKIKKNML